MVVVGMFAVGNTTAQRLREHSAGPVWALMGGDYVVIMMMMRLLQCASGATSGPHKIRVWKSSICDLNYVLVRR